LLSSNYLALKENFSESSTFMMFIDEQIELFGRNGFLID
jgi:hypothetical protein